MYWRAKVVQLLLDIQVHFSTGRLIFEYTSTHVYISQKVHIEEYKQEMGPVYSRL
jgi:hypothetical protein